MKLSAESVLPFPREVVYRAYRDRLVELVPFLPNVRAIEVQSRKDEPPVTSSPSPASSPAPSPAPPKSSSWQ